MPVTTQNGPNLTVTPPLAPPKFKEGGGGGGGNFYAWPFAEWLKNDLG